MSRWSDQFVGDRMAVDRSFSERVAASEFSSQEWGTIMTAVDLEIEQPADPEQARLVADTRKVEQVLPAIEEMRQSIPAIGGGPPGSGGQDAGRTDSSGGVLDSIRRFFGVGEDVSDHRAESAAALADEYARTFQDHLETHGKWERACSVAASTADVTRDAEEMDFGDEHSGDIDHTAVEAEERSADGDVTGSNGDETGADADGPPDTS